MSRTMLTTICLLCLAAASSVNSAVPAAMNYQALLTDTAGDPVADGSYSVTFTIYDAPTGGDSKWTETQSVLTNGGLFSVILGLINPIEDTVFNAPSRFLGIKVGTDEEMTDRVELVTVPHAFRTDVADSAQQIGDDVITSAKIVDGTIQLIDIGDNGAVAGQVMKWSGSAWIADDDQTGGGNGWTDDGNYVRLETIDDSVGLGTVSPTEKLDVEGNIHASGTISSGSSITIDGVNDKITSTSGGLDFDNENLSTTGTIDLGGFKLSGGSSGLVLTSDASGVGTWQAVGVISQWSLSGGAIYTNDKVGIARQGSTLYGTNDSTHVNLGVKSFTGESGQNRKYATVGGGYLSKAEGDNATVSGGRLNTASGSESTIAGGFQNKALGSSASVGGGSNNAAEGLSATVGGGAYDTASAQYTTVAGGYTNVARFNASTVGGGRFNTARSIYSTVSGGQFNRAVGDAATVSGGQYDTASGDLSTVAGGSENTASGELSSICGGFRGDASGVASFIGGGAHNTADGDSSTTCGGYWNKSSGNLSFVGGGRFNTADGEHATIAGGARNYAGTSGTVSGGTSDSAFGVGSTVAGGQTNNAHGFFSVIGGGNRNWSGNYATVGGGQSDTASGEYSVVSGGYQNVADGDTSTVAGGTRNRASGLSAVVSGGWRNTASGENATVSGGESNAALYPQSAEVWLTRPTRAGPTFQEGPAT